MFGSNVKCQHRKKSLKVFKCVTKVTQTHGSLSDLGEKKTIESEVCRPESSQLSENTHIDPIPSELTNTCVDWTDGAEIANLENWQDLVIL